MKTALIFGITGQDGYYLAKHLLARGYQVCGTSRDTGGRAMDYLQSDPELRVVRTFAVCTNDFYSVFRVINDVNPDEIYNLSGQSSVGRSFEQPLETHHSIVSATINILEVARLTSRPMRLYFAGSSEAFGETPPGGATESTTFEPKSPYGVAKAAATWQVRTYRESYGLHASTGILFNHESRRRPSHFVTRKIVDAAKRIAAGSNEKLVLGDISIARDWGYAPEYVDAMWRILQCAQARDWVIATGDHHTLQDFVRLTFERLDLDWRASVTSDPGLRRPNEIQTTCGNPQQAYTELGWRATVRLPELIQRLLADEPV